MSRLGVSFEEVAVAAIALVEAGELPTIEKIRDQLGKRGSFSTISKYLKEWRDGQTIAKANAVPPPDQVQAAVSAVWQKLHQESQATIESIKTETTQQLQQAEKEVEAANAALTSLQADFDTLKTQHYALSAQKELLMLDNKQLQSEYQLLRERFDALERHHQEMKTTQEQQLHRLEKHVDAEIERLKRESEKEVQLAQQLADTLKSHYEAARIDSLRQLDQLRVDNQTRLDVIKRLEVENAGLRESLNGKSHVCQQIELQLNEAKQLNKMQQAQWETIHDKRFVTEDVVAAFQSMPTQLTDQIQAMLSEQVNVVMGQLVKAVCLQVEELVHVKCEQ